MPQHRNTLGIVLRQRGLRLSPLTSHRNRLPQRRNTGFGGGGLLGPAGPFGVLQFVEGLLEDGAFLPCLGETRPGELVKVGVSLDPGFALADAQELGGLCPEHGPGDELIFE